MRTVVSVLAGLPTVCYLAASTMADTKGANISRMVLKQAGRAKEKVGCSKVHSERESERGDKKALLQKCDHVKL